MTRKRRPSAATLKILKCLTDSPNGLHGYALLKTSGLASGTLYPILARLADRGWLEKAWDLGGATSGQPRRIYWITALGRAQLEHMAKDQQPSVNAQTLGAAP